MLGVVACEGACGANNGQTDDGGSAELLLVQRALGAGKFAHI